MNGKSITALQGIIFVSLLLRLWIQDAARTWRQSRAAPLEQDAQEESALHCLHCGLCCREQGFFLSSALFPEPFSGNQIFIKTPAFLTSITGPLGSQDVLEARYLIRKQKPLAAASGGFQLGDALAAAGAKLLQQVPWGLMGLWSGCGRRGSAAVWHRELRVLADFRK